MHDIIGLISFRNQPIMALNVSIGIGSIRKMMSICIADKRNTLTHMCSGCASD